MVLNPGKKVPLNPPNVPLVNKEAPDLKVLLENNEKDKEKKAKEEEKNIEEDLTTMVSVKLKWGGVVFLEVNLQKENPFYNEKFK